MKLHFTNYRILRDAEVDVKGLTVIRGENDAGKSCVMRGLRALVRNDSSDGHINYNATDFLVSVSPNENLTIDYTRVRGGSGAYAIRRAGQDPEHFHKLNRKDLQSVFPESPFSLFAFTDTKFTPNFVFQKEVPVWGQVDAYAFFSSMFAPVASLSEHILRVRKEVSQLSDADVKSSAELNVLAEQITQAQTALAALNVAAIEAAARDAADIQDNEQVILNSQVVIQSQEAVIAQNAGAASRAEWVPVIRSATSELDAIARAQLNAAELQSSIASLREVQGAISLVPSQEELDRQIKAAADYLKAYQEQSSLQVFETEVKVARSYAARAAKVWAVTQGIAPDFGLGVLETVLRAMSELAQAQASVAAVTAQIPHVRDEFDRHSRVLSGIDICSTCLRPLKPGELVHAHIGDSQ
jgi:hypothetical protein